MAYMELGLYSQEFPHLCCEPNVMVSLHSSDVSWAGMGPETDTIPGDWLWERGCLGPYSC